MVNNPSAKININLIGSTVEAEATGLKCFRYSEQREESRVCISPPLRAFFSFLTKAFIIEHVLLYKACVSRKTFDIEFPSVLPL